MSFQYLQYSVSEQVATITLNRPDQANVFHIDAARELEQVARECLVSDSIKVVVLTGNGKLFSAGGDLAYMHANADTLDYDIKALADSLHNAYASFARMSAPLVVALNGTAAGIGLSLALLGDITIAVEKAKFVGAYSGVGLSPDGGLTYLLPRIVGLKRASEFLMTSKALSAQEALEWGMINHVVAAEALQDTLAEIVASLKASSSGSLKAVKHLLLSSQAQSMEGQMHLEGMNLSQNAFSSNGKEGVSAYLEGRRPNFV